MPVNNQKFNSMTAEQRKAVPLLPSYICGRCHKTKLNSQYSKNETNKYATKVANGQMVNAVTAKLICRSCKGEQMQELECEYCHLVKVLDEFSKSQRRSSRWCKECISWKESQEPGLMTAPSPNGELAPDEDATFTEGYDDPFGEDSDYSDAYDDIDDAGDGISIAESQISFANGGQQSGAYAAALTSSMSQLAVSTKESTASNPYEARLKQNTASVASWTTVDPRRRNAVQQPVPQPHHPQRDLGDVSNSLQAPSYSTMSTATENASGASVRSTNSIQQPPVRTSRWAKPLVKKEMPYYAIKRPVHQQKDHDESEDEDDFNHDN